ncbi:hypothetical protein BGZ93_009582 [Podila epicladia]|nr:hypothetical protein BGZ93_009582 [Podila epicladia]
MYGKQQHQHQSQHYQLPSFQSPSVINRHYQVSSALIPAPVPQYSYQQTSQHPSYPNRISLHGSPPGIYRTPAAHGIGQPRGVIVRPATGTNKVPTSTAAAAAAAADSKPVHGTTTGADIGLFCRTSHASDKTSNTLEAKLD